MAEIDYTEAVRKLKTSDLVLVLAYKEARLSIVDPDGKLAERCGLFGIGLLDPRPEVKAAVAELEGRLRAVIVASAGELDRRIPIPGGP